MFNPFKNKDKLSDREIINVLTDFVEGRMDGKTLEEQYIHLPEVIAYITDPKKKSFDKEKTNKDILDSFEVMPLINNGNEHGIAALFWHFLRNNGIETTLDSKRSRKAHKINCTKEEYVQIVKGEYKGKPLLSSKKQLKDIKPLEALVGFVEGTVTYQEFIDHFLHRADVKKLLTDPQYDWRLIFKNKNPYEEIVSRPEILYSGYSIIGVLEKYLDRMRIPYEASPMYQVKCDFSISAMPSWLDLADEDFFYREIASHAEGKTKNELIGSVRKILKEKFRAVKKYPVWIQGAQWPICEGQPLVFIDSINLQSPELFHDNGRLYIFYNPNDHTFQTVTQFY